mgnify:FL=1
MATYGQLAMAGQASNDRVAFETAQNKEADRRSKANRWGGWGRTLGLLGTGLGIAAMTNPLTGIPAAIAIGLGGLAGRSAGRAAGGGRERDADKNIDALFYQGKQREFAKEIGTYQEGVRERMLVDTGTDALTAFMFAKYAKPSMDKAGSFMKGMPEGLEAGKEMGLNPFQAAGEYVKSFSPNAPFVVPGGAAEAVGGLASSATPEVQRAKEMSQYLAGPEAGMFGEEDIVRRLSLGGSRATQGATPSNFNIMTTPDNPMGLAPSSPNPYGQEGNFFDMISPHTPQPRRVIY